MRGQLTTQAGFIANALPGEDLIDQRAGVVHVQVDLPGDDRLPNDGRTAETKVRIINLQSFLAKPVRDQVSQQGGFSIFLGFDADFRALTPLWRSRKTQSDRRKNEILHAIASRSASHGPRCDSTNWVTNGDAGRWTRSRNIPR